MEPDAYAAYHCVAEPPRHVLSHGIDAVRVRTSRRERWRWRPRHPPLLRAEARPASRKVRVNRGPRRSGARAPDQPLEATRFPTPARDPCPPGRREWRRDPASRRRRAMKALCAFCASIHRSNLRARRHRIRPTSRLRMTSVASTYGACRRPRVPRSPRNPRTRSGDADPPAPPRSAAAARRSAPSWRGLRRPR